MLVSKALEGFYIDRRASPADRWLGDTGNDLGLGFLFSISVVGCQQCHWR
jgi:hypothetical protein